MRILPEPVCEQWDREAHRWTPAEPEVLWVAEARRFARSLTRKDSTQLALPLQGERNPSNSPPREKPNHAAYRIWRDAPESWKKLTEPVHAHPWRVLLFLAHFGPKAVDLMESNPGLGWMLSCRAYDPETSGAGDPAQTLLE